MRQDSPKAKTTKERGIRSDTTLLPQPDEKTSPEHIQAQMAQQPPITP
ncbi:MAG TPA: hypothetical protein VMS09_17830 [Paenibacillus sp.]|nr:hypothetical protein [Paenibacillus sp.]HUC93848.1 hypothetical protein [Paenibacillus sp.]